MDYNDAGSKLRKCLGCGKNGIQGTMVESSNGFYHQNCADALKTKPNHLKEKYQLPEAHLDVAKIIAKESRYLKRSCSKCYDRGWIGTNGRNELVICHRCVDSKVAVENWKKYVRLVHDRYYTENKVPDQETELFLQENAWALKEDTHTEDTEGDGKEIETGASAGGGV